MKEKNQIIIDKIEIIDDKDLLRNVAKHLVMLVDLQEEKNETLLEFVNKTQKSINGSINAIKILCDTILSADLKVPKKVFEILKEANDIITTN
jgi:hypothetical protein